MTESSFTPEQAQIYEKKVCTECYQSLDAQQNSDGSLTFGPHLKDELEVCIGSYRTVSGS